jgi:hypothetical protein
MSRPKLFIGAEAQKELDARFLALGAKMALAVAGLLSAFARAMDAIRSLMTWLHGMSSHSRLASASGVRAAIGKAMAGGGAQSVYRQHFEAAGLISSEFRTGSR